MNTPRAPGAHTRVFAILGDPVAHSLSPAIHNAAFAATQLDALFVALRTETASLASALRTLAAAGGGGSVTVPHKEAAVAVLDNATEAVRRTGACNTFWGESGRLCGDNTDLEGFLAAARQHGIAFAGARVLVLGAGGAAAAVLLALNEERPAEIAVWNRSPARARALTARTGVNAEILGAPEAKGYDVIVNATSLGLAPGDPLPLDPRLVATGTVLLDLVYAPRDTEWVRAGRARGLAAWDGKEMLLRQAAAAFLRWTGRDAPLDAMRRGLAEGLVPRS